MAARTKKTPEAKQPVKTALPEGLENTFKVRIDLKGAYLFSDDAWFFYPKQAEKYEKDNEVSRKYVANPHFGKE